MILASDEKRWFAVSSTHRHRGHCPRRYRAGNGLRAVMKAPIEQESTFAMGIAHSGSANTKVL
ncbi:hypothetical protein GALMADRAFT_254158 [Galerina marginata CBS 339.88]|uniref:Uncharacterized protein n=1 Tax=Galerina marginata (strain CBS 339.88) TaxID=685588 RepID=A0A067SX92_GALM3|nr:hypothetical protein GALMADRAFT_254158 [Galerina marginata CBS 339.88]